MQLSLFRIGPLFSQRLLNRYLDSKRQEFIPAEAEKTAAIAKWVSSIQGARRDGLTETSLEQQFNHVVLEQVLGYRLVPSEHATAWPKPPTRITQIAGEPDLALGRFEPHSEPVFRGVVELKPPGTPLDKPQTREGRRTPVEQAFEYATQILGVRWVVVSDMLEIRLYSVDSMEDFEKFSLDDFRFEPSAKQALPRLFHVLSCDALIGDGGETPMHHLHMKALGLQRNVRDGFYSAYYRIRADLFSVIRERAQQLNGGFTSEDALQATQRLLDRMLFIFFCEDAPDPLIPSGSVEQVASAARSLPGPSDHKVYDAIKALFREIDEGSPTASLRAVPAYNGELFKEHRILDHIDIPDALHDRIYPVEVRGDAPRNIHGVWGLHEFDFWSELNEHLLGHVFEESLSDVVEMRAGTLKPLKDKLAERQRYGIYFTSQVLSDFLATSAMNALLQEHFGGAPDSVEAYEARQKYLESVRVVDFACGSGAFLVSAYRILLREYARTRDALTQLRPGMEQRPLFDYVDSATQASLLRNCLNGVDLLPQAVELAKLALWLRSARKGERIADLGSNLVVENSLDIEKTWSKLGCGPGSFDLVLGNPPWGIDLSNDEHESACRALGLPATPRWDSWELFLLLGLCSLKPGGRLALVLPDTFFSPEKARTRRIVLEKTVLEKLHNLGPDWFGPNVRMGTVLMQARAGGRPLMNDISCLLLSGQTRRDAIGGSIPLAQLEAQLARRVPQERCAASEAADIEVFRSRRDDEVMATMASHSRDLAAVCERGRGEEMAKSGLLWCCPSCLSYTTPGRISKGVYLPKPCPQCAYQLTAEECSKVFLVEPLGVPRTLSAPFLDGDDISRRYAPVAPTRQIRLDLSGFKYKQAALFAGRKLMVRQAGVGLVATLDESGARCPQSVYVYRVRDEFTSQGYRPEFILGTLLSRTMTYFVFKRFGEVDPARAHAKLTHERLATLPIPKVDPASPVQRAAHDRICDRVTALLSNSVPLGGVEDREVEQALRGLWGLSAEDGAYVNGEFAGLPESQAVRDLFPGGPPKRGGLL